MAVIGSVNIDHVVVADAFPAPGQTVVGLSARTGLGGKGSNQAVASALAGAPTALIARVGADPEGARARDGLIARGVDVSEVHAVSEAATGTAWITVANHGGTTDNTIVVVPGANHAWPKGDPLGTAAEAEVVLAQLEVPMEVVLRAAERATGKFVLNAAPAMWLPPKLVARCDVIVVNEHEQVVAAGLPPETATQHTEERTIADAHDALLRQGARAVVTTLGEAGAVLTTESEGTIAIPAIPATVVDTTGAGDAFTGVLAARLALGDSLATAARWGTAAGSLAVRALGAQESYPDAETLARTVRETA